MHKVGIIVPIAVAVGVLLGGGRAPARPRAPIPSGTSDDTPREEDECALAFSGELSFGEEIAIDQIRVDLRDDDPLTPAAGVTRVEVATGTWARVLRVALGGRWGLRFEPELRGRSFRVSLDPVFTARRNACVETVALLRRGVVVAVIRP